MKLLENIPYLARNINIWFPKSFTKSN